MLPSLHHKQVMKIFILLPTWWKQTCIELSTPGKTWLMITANILCINCSEAACTCTLPISSIGISNQVIFCSIKVVISRFVILVWQEVMRKLPPHSLSMSLQDGTEPQRLFWMHLITPTHSMCGQLVAYLLSYYEELLYSQVMTTWIKSKEPLQYLALQLTKTWLLLETISPGSTLENYQRETSKDGPVFIQRQTQ